MERLISMILRQIGRRLMSRGVNAGVDRVFGPRNDAGANTSQERPQNEQQARQARKDRRQAKQAMRISRQSKRF